MRFLAPFLCLLGFIGVAQAQSFVAPGPAVMGAPYLTIPLGYQQMTSLATATPLPSIPSNAIYAVVLCTGQMVNWRDDGTAPTASIGMPLNTNTQIVFAEKPLSVVQIIQATASATCNVSYYK